MKKIILILINLSFLVFSSLAVLASVSVSNFTQSDVSVEEGMLIYKYETKQEDIYEDKGEFDAETYSQNQFQASTPDLLSIDTTDDFLGLNHFGDNPPDTSQIDWWDDDSDLTTKYNWRYRQCFEVDHSAVGSTNLNEYQLYLDFDTASLISSGKMINQGQDIRFLDSSLNPIDFYIADNLNTNSTRVWLQPDTITAGNTETYCMYYGYVPYLDNPIPANIPTNLSSKEDVFTYTNPKQIYYTLQNTVDNSITNFASYTDSNQVSVDTYTGTLDKYDAVTFPTATSLTQTTSFQTTGPINGSFNNNATDALVPAAAAGTQFVYRMDRNTNEFSFISPYCNSNIEVRNSLNNIVTGGSFTVNQGAFFNLTTTDVAATGIPNDTAVIIESTNNCPVYVYHHTTNSQDSFPLWPAATEWYGVGSGAAHIAALQNGTTVTIIRSDGTTSTVNLNRGGQTTFAGASQGNTFSHRIFANNPIGVNQLADGDGTDASTFLPERELGYRYYFPQQSDYITISAYQGLSGTINLYNDATSCGVGAPTSTQSITGVATRPGFARFATIPAGSCIVSNIPIHAYYEYTAQQDETNIWNSKQNRQYVHPYPSDVKGTTQTGTWSLGSTTHEWTRRLQVTVTNNSTSTLNEFQYPIDISSTNIFSFAQTNGGDIRVAGVLGNGTDNQSQYFVDQYDPATSNGLVWVKLNGLAPSASQTFYLYFRAINDFNTLSLTPEIWLDGMDIDGDNTNGNNPTGALSTWQDKSGNNNDATQTNPFDQPNINGNVVEFRGNANATDIGDFLDIPNIDMQTFFVVLDNVQDNPITFGGLHGLVGVQGGIYMFLSTDNLGYQVSFDGQTSEQASFNLNNGPVIGPGENIGVGDFPGGQQVFWAQYVNPQLGWDYIGALDFGLVTEGYNPYLDIKEFIGIDGTVTATQRSNFNNYLIAKWGTNQSTAGLTTTGSLNSIFTTTTPRTTYYVVDSQNILNQLEIISFTDGNTITDGLTTVTLDEGEIDIYPFNVGVDQNDIYSVTGPLSINFSEDGTDSAIPISFAGTEFVYNVDRDSDVYSLLAPFVDATVQIQESSTGSWITTQTVNLTAGIPQTINNDAPDTGGFKLLSDEPVLAYHNNSTNDSKPLYPTSQAFEESTGNYELYGLVSGNLLLAASNPATTTVTIYRSDGTSSVVSLNSSNNYTYSEPGQAQGNALAYHLVSDGPIGASSYADGDGAEAAIFLPRKEFSDEYILPNDTQYLSIVAPDPSTTCRVYDELGVEITSGPATLDSVPPQTSGALTSPFPNQIFIGGDDTSDGAFFFGGYSLRCDEAVYAFFEHHLDSAITDETTLLTFPQVRQRARIQPIVQDLDLVNEEGLYFASGFDSNSTALDPVAFVEFDLDKSALLNSEHIFWDKVEWSESIPTRSQQNSVDPIFLEVLYANPSPTCAAATYTSDGIQIPINISTNTDTSPSFTDIINNQNYVKLADIVSDNQCLKLRFSFQTGDEAYTPKLNQVAVTSKVPTILEDNLNSPTISIDGNDGVIYGDDRQRILKITNNNSGLVNSTCNLDYLGDSNNTLFTNFDFEFYESPANTIQSLFDYPPFPVSPPDTSPFSTCDDANDLSLYLDHIRTGASSETFDLNIKQDINNLNGPSNSREFTLNISGV